MTMKTVQKLAFLLLFLMTTHAVAETPALVDAPWLKTQLEAPGLVVLDIQAAKDFQRFHIPGAVNAPYDRWRTTPPKKGTPATGEGSSQLPSMLPEISALEALLGGLGISNDDHVVVVATGRGSGDLAASARVFWTLKVLGHDKVSVLDGGLVGYADTGAQLSRQVEPRPATQYKADFRPELVPDAQAVKDAIAADAQPVDARSEGEFVGVYTGGKKERPGTIPGSKHLPHDWVSEDGSGRLRSAGALKALFEARGVETYGDQIHFCHSGNRAALTWFAAYAVLGNKDARLYDGSMMEWARDDSLPIEQKLQLCEAC
jgi:thiosulfate/3-mercaptopyruvate sulfurtransferase